MVRRSTLPPDFSGPRSYEDTVQDLLHVAAHPSRDRVRLDWPNDPDAGDHDGQLRLGRNPRAGEYHAYVGDTFAFALSPQRFRSCGLETLDDDDYWTMVIELDDQTVRLADGYNGY
jgi:hypothetical protein